MQLLPSRQGVVRPATAVTVLSLGLSPLYNWALIYRLGLGLDGAALAVDAVQVGAFHLGLHWQERAGAALREPASFPSSEMFLPTPPCRRVYSFALNCIPISGTCKSFPEPPLPLLSPTGACRPIVPTRRAEWRWGWAST